MTSEIDITKSTKRLKLLATGEIVPNNPAYNIKENQFKYKASNPDTGFYYVLF